MGSEKEYNPERCDWHEQQMREQERRTSRIENALFTTNGEPGLLETVRGIARIQRWHTVVLALLLAMQAEAPVREVVAAVLRKMVTP